MELAIEATGITKIFGRHGKGPFKKPIVEALKKVDFTIKSGENYCLLGPNGSGKTTLIRCILGLLEAEGSIKLLGYNIPKQRNKIIHKIGYMPQETSLYPDLSVEETLQFFARMYGLKNRERRNKAIETILDVLKLKEWQKMIVENLSGGMKRRLSLACSLVHEPTLIMLDEPTVGVDPKLRLTFWDYFNKLSKEGATILTTTHVMDEAEKSHIIGFMRDGRLIAEGTIDELKKRIPKYKKLTVKTTIENTESIGKLISKEYDLEVFPSPFKIDVFYDDNSILDPILELIKNETKIGEMVTTEPTLEDIFIHFSSKKEGVIDK
ncbi:MAG: ATP-binding cassette domain-containing protein [Candidatus Hodarchaeota archaeon]